MGSSIEQVKKIIISGYYGFNNSGDEAVLQSILLALEEQGAAQGVRVQPVVLSIRPESTARMYGVESVHRMKPGEVIRALRSSDGLISGGGSLLQDATGWKTIPYYLGVMKLAQWLGKPVFIYSQGIGPVHRRIYDRWIRRIFMKSRYVSVRDIESRQLLARMGVDGARVEVVPDPVMGLPLREGAAAGAAAGGAAGAPVVGVSVRYWNKDRSDLDGIAAALRRVAEAQPHAVFRMLPFHMPDDLEASRHVAAQAGLAPERVVFAEQAEHPQEMLRQVSECSLLIGMRLHSLIYAASQMVPMIGVSYDPKIGQFLGRLGMEPAVTTAGLERDPAEGRRIADSALSLLDDADAWRRGHELAVAELKRQAQQPAQQIIQYLRNKG